MPLDDVIDDTMAAVLAEAGVKRLRALYDTTKVAKDKVEQGEILSALLNDEEAVDEVAVALLLRAHDTERALAALTPFVPSGLLTRLERLLKKRVRQMEARRKGLRVVEPEEGPPPGRVSVPPGDHLLNLTTVLETDEHWAGRIRWNELKGIAEIDGDTVTDTDEGEAAVWIGREYDMHPPTTRVHEAIRIVARRHSYHPVRTYLDSLRWDGTPRISSWLTDYGGVDPSMLTQAYGRCFLIGAVARAFQPGCKMDEVLLFQGPQGAGKSRLLRALSPVGSWFSDSALRIGHADGYQALQGVWIYELGELDSVRRSEWATVKAFLGEQVSRYRPSYGRNVVEAPRQCVFAGTTNEDTFLGDSTGARRFWVVEVKRSMHPEALAAARDQLWAEAVFAFQAGEPWRLDSETSEAQKVDVEQYQVVDPWRDVIAPFVAGRNDVRIADILAGPLAKRPHELTKADEMRVGAILRSLGWSRGRDRRRLWTPGLPF